MAPMAVQDGEQKAAQGVRDLHASLKGPASAASRARRRAGSDPPGGTAASSWGVGRLYWFDELPPELAYNKYVKSGYRAGLTYRDCCASIFQYHNETGNIWVHLVPALVVVTCLLSGHMLAWPEQHVAFWESITPILLCFCLSVAYHTCQAHQQDYKMWLLLDVSGIFLIFVASMHRVLHWGFPCHPQLCNAFVGVYYTTAVAAVASAVFAKSALQRGLPMLGLLVIRLAALATRISLGSGSPIAIWHYIITEVCSVLGATLNVLRLPERWLHDPDRPRQAGLLDYWGNSHQLMHVLVAAALLNLHLGGRVDWQYFAANPVCPADLVAP